MQSLNVDAIIRGGLTRFTDQLGKLWCSLADYYIRSGHFEKVCGHTLPPVHGTREMLGDTRVRKLHKRARAHVCSLKACWQAHPPEISQTWVLHGCVACTH